jgi:hypothetical protein
MNYLKDESGRPEYLSYTQLDSPDTRRHRGMEGVYSSQPVVFLPDELKLREDKIMGETWTLCF